MDCTDQGVGNRNHSFVIKACGDFVNLPRTALPVRVYQSCLSDQQGRTDTTRTYLGVNRDTFHEKDIKFDSNNKVIVTCTVVVVLLLLMTMIMMVVVQMTAMMMMMMMQCSFMNLFQGMICLLLGDIAYVTIQIHKAKYSLKAHPQCLEPISIITLKAPVYIRHSLMMLVP